MDDDSHRERWTHTAIESLALFHGPLISECAAVRMTIVELVVRRALTLTAADQKRLGLFTRRTNILVPGPAFQQDLPEPLASVMVRYRRLAEPSFLATGSGVPVQELARSIFGSARPRTFFGRALEKQPADVKGFVETVLLPHMANRGWFLKNDSGSVLPWRSAPWETTVAGSAELDRLHGILTDGRDSLPRWVYQEPGRAAQFVACAGPALLLIPGAAQSIRTLNARLSGQDPLAPPVPEPADRPNAMGASREGAVTGVFSVAALAGVFGPGEFDGFDSAMFSVSEDVCSLWTEMFAGHGPGG